MFNFCDVLVGFPFHLLAKPLDSDFTVGFFKGHAPVTASSPVGTVISYAGPVNNDDNTTQPTSYPNPSSNNYSLHLERQGWLFCDGRAVAVSRYPELFQKIGYIYGEKSNGYFYLPDYRGYFLRGTNQSADGPDGMLRDPDAQNRKAGANGGWQGNAVGSVQLDTLQNHQHNYDKAQADSAIGYSGSTAYTSSVDTATSAPNKTDSDNNIAVRVAKETRAKNIYVNFLIRHRR